MYNISEYWGNVQRQLLPYLEECLPPGLTERHRQLILVLDVVRVEAFVPSSWQQWRGRRRKDRRPLARAFLAKACLNFPTTEALLDRLRADAVLRRLCGWERRSQIPSASTFSRAFAELARTHLLDTVHAALVAKYAGDTLFWHVSRDSTAIVARERVQPNPDKEPPAVAGDAAAASPEVAAAPGGSDPLAPPSPPKRKRGRPRKGTVPEPPPHTRLQRQYNTPADQTDALLEELPRTCGLGSKRNAKGHLEHWPGYKFHVDIGDSCFPLLALTTSAWLHDSQVAIPMARKTAQRVTSLYDLMDRAFDADYIVQTSLDLKHVPIIEPSRRRGPHVALEPDRAERYHERTTAERFNSRLKDDHGGRHVRVRGGAKVHTHLMFGLLVILADVVLSWVP